MQVPCAYPGTSLRVSVVLWKEEQTPESHSSIDQVHREMRTAPNVANAPSLSKQLETGRLPQMLAGYFSTSMSLYLAVQGW